MTLYQIAKFPLRLDLPEAWEASGGTMKGKRLDIIIEVAVSIFIIMTSFPTIGSRFFGWSVISGARNGVLWSVLFVGIPYVIFSITGKKAAVFIAAITLGIILFLNAAAVSIRLTPLKNEFRAVASQSYKRECKKDGPGNCKALFQGKLDVVTAKRDRWLKKTGQTSIIKDWSFSDPGGVSFTEIYLPFAKKE